MKNAGNKKIFVLVPSLCIGGQERQAILLAEQLRKIADCRIVVFFNTAPCYSTDMEVVNLHLPPCRGKAGKAIQQIRRALRLTRLKRKYGTDLVISYGDTANLTNILSKGPGERVVSLRISWSAEYSAIKKYIYKKSSRILCQTVAMREILLRNYKNVTQKTDVFYNIFDMEGIEKKACEPCELEFGEVFNIISVGRLEKQKGFRHLIAAFAHMNHRIPNVKLIILGEGSERKNLEALAKCLGLEENIFFAGSVPNPYQYMKNADLFVSSSCAEGFPNVLVEAMACGLPVIATDCETGPREILSFANQESNTAAEIEYSDYGILVPAFQEDDIPEPMKEEILAKAMLELANNPEKREHYAFLARKRAYEFSIQNAKEKINGLIEYTE